VWNCWFFLWVNTHPFDLKFVAFSPKVSGDSYLEFEEKPIPGEFFINFVHTKAILYQNLWNFTLLSAICILDLYRAEKIHTSTFIVVCTQVRRHVNIQITKRRYAKEKQGRYVSENKFCSVWVWDLLSLTPWVSWSEIFTRRSKMCLFSFGLDLSPRFVPQGWQWIFYRSLRGLKGRFVCVWNCLIFFVGENSSVWPEICCVLFQI